MRSSHLGRTAIPAGLLALFFLAPFPAAARQGPPESPRQSADSSPAQADLAVLLHDLQSQVQQLNSQLGEMKADSAQLRSELQVTRAELAALKNSSTSAIPSSQTVSAPSSPESSSTEERLSRIEENQQLADAKIAEQSQTKVESSSKYRVRLSGIVLFNTYINRGSIDNQDFPQVAIPRDSLGSDGSFGGSLRQTQIALQAFGPTVAGARTSAEVHLDFAGGFPKAPNGTSFGLMRLRTGTVRFDWQNTSLIAGQDSLFFVPLSPTSLASLAVPALSYSGNLWAWAPQIRIEHTIHVGESSSLILQGGILDSMSGDLPSGDYGRGPTWGEQSGLPAIAGRTAFTHSFFGQPFTIGAGGFFGRQDWGFSRKVDAWAATIDFALPLGSRFEFDSAVFRGRGLGGLGGGIGQTALWSRSFIDPTTEIYGLNSIGGWAQLKFKATSKFQINGAFGEDNPFTSDMRAFGGSQQYFASPLSKNLNYFANFIYQPRSDIVLSLEYRRLKTFKLDSNADSANHINFSVGYIF
jgi:hypothetical protein